MASDQQGFRVMLYNTAPGVLVPRIRKTMQLMINSLLKTDIAKAVLVLVCQKH